MHQCALVAVNDVTKFQFHDAKSLPGEWKILAKMKDSFPQEMTQEKDVGGPLHKEKLTIKLDNSSIMKCKQYNQRTTKETLHRRGVTNHPSPKEKNISDKRIARLAISHLENHRRRRWFSAG